MKHSLATTAVSPMAYNANKQLRTKYVVATAVPPPMAFLVKGQNLIVPVTSNSLALMVMTVVLCRLSICSTNK